jgi:hypothetical protein
MAQGPRLAYCVKMPRDPGLLPIVPGSQMQRERQLNLPWTTGNSAVYLICKRP